MTPKFVLYQAQRSSASWRARWGMTLKRLSFEAVWIDLLKKQQASAAFATKNPMKQVPMLLVDGRPLAESLAILEWLEEHFPEPALLPKDSWLRAQTRQLSLLVAAGIQPLQGLSVLQHQSPDEEKRAEYARHWIGAGLANYETSVKETARKFSVGDAVTPADLCLIPQVWNARRFQMDVSTWPKVREIFERCLETPECRETQPSGS